MTIEQRVEIARAESKFLHRAMGNLIKRLLKEKGIEGKVEIDSVIKITARGEFIKVVTDRQGLSYNEEI